MSVKSQDAVCIPPSGAQNLLSLSQKWLLCVGNVTVLHFSVFQLKLDINTEIVSRISIMPSVSRGFRPLTP